MTLIPSLGCAGSTPAARRIGSTSAGGRAGAFSAASAARRTRGFDTPASCSRSSESWSRTVMNAMRSATDFSIRRPAAVCTGPTPTL